MMTPEQREDLKQAALKATPGPWDFDTAETPYKIAGGEVVGGDALPWGAVYTTAEYETPDGTESLVVASEIGCDNGRFVARANPAAILSLIAQVEALTVPQWISVEDRIPPIGEEVIVFVPGGRVPVTALMRLIRWEGSTDFYWDNGYPGKGNMHIGTSITHWMSMPAAPTIPAIPGTKEGA